METNASYALAYKQLSVHRKGINSHWAQLHDWSAQQHGGAKPPEAVETSWATRHSTLVYTRCTSLRNSRHRSTADLSVVLRPIRLTAKGSHWPPGQCPDPHPQEGTPKPRTHGLQLPGLLSGSREARQVLLGGTTHTCTHPPSENGLWKEDPREPPSPICSQHPNQGGTRCPGALISLRFQMEL